MLALLLQTSAAFNWHLQQLYDGLLPYVEGTAVALLLWITAKLHLNSDKLKSALSLMTEVRDLLRVFAQTRSVSANAAPSPNPPAANLPAVAGTEEKIG